MRNHVQWIPTWGAIQGAAHTLSSRRGNAMDIAGLEIALHAYALDGGPRYCLSNSFAFGGSNCSVLIAG